MLLYLYKMADVHSKETRSYNMSRIKGKNTKPEMLVRNFLHAHGYRYRLHDKKLPGKPDIVLPKYRTVIFVHGYFCMEIKTCRPARLQILCSYSNERLIDARKNSYLKQEHKDHTHYQHETIILIVFTSIRYRFYLISFHFSPVLKATYPTGTIF
jgi:DNA mismatch endonuclease Vsr